MHCYLFKKFKFKTGLENFNKMCLFNTRQPISRKKYEKVRNDEVACLS